MHIWYFGKALSCRPEDYYNHPYALPTSISITLTSIYAKECPTSCFSSTNERVRRATTMDAYLAPGQACMSLSTQLSNMKRMKQAFPYPLQRRSRPTKIDDHSQPKYGLLSRQYAYTLQLAYTCSIAKSYGLEIEWHFVILNKVFIRSFPFHTIHRVSHQCIPASNENE